MENHRNKIYQTRCLTQLEKYKSYVKSIYILCWVTFYMLSIVLKYPLIIFCSTWKIRRIHSKEMTSKLMNHSLCLSVCLSLTHTGTLHYSYRGSFDSLKQIIELKRLTLKADITHVYISFESPKNPWEAVGNNQCYPIF